MAFDSGGAAAVRDFIRPPSLADLPPVILDIMGWDPAIWKRAGTPAYPCLIDTRHEVARLYGIVNVPTAVWIDENGKMVRPPEPAGSSDAFRTMNPETFEIPAAAAADGKRRRAIYVDALRDWIEKGEKSIHALSPDEVRRRLRGPDETASRAAAHFRLGIYLHGIGAEEAAKPHLDEAIRLRPDCWTYRRQSMVLGPGMAGQLAGGPEYWLAVQALGDRYYYPPIEMNGMPAPVPARTLAQ